MRKIVIAAFAASLAVPALAQGLSIELGPQERTRFKEYVVKEKRPATKFAPSFKFSLGATLPEDTVIYDVPDQRTYGYVVVDGRYVYVDRRNRRVIEYID